jgi:hypothetical protein
MQQPRLKLHCSTGKLLIRRCSIVTRKFPPLQATSHGHVQQHCTGAVSGREHHEPAPGICDSHPSDLIVELMR